MGDNKEPNLWVLGTNVRNRRLASQPEDKILPFTPSAFHSSKENELDLDDFFSRKEFSSSIDTFQQELEKLLISCDKILAISNIKGSFFDSAFWFTVQLSGLFYIHSVSESIAEKYKEINIVVPEGFKCLSIDDCSIQDLRFSNIGTGLIPSLQFLHLGLPGSILIHNEATISKKNFSLLKRLQFIKRSPEILLRKTSSLLQSIKNFFYLPTTKKKILVAQPGYDVDHLIRHYSNKTFNTISLIEEIEKRITFKAIPTETLSSLENEIETFLNKYLPRFSSSLLRFFISYISNVSAYSDSIEEEVRKALEFYSPDALLFSNGATNLVERKSCLVANELSVPVYFMRHQGIELSFVGPTHLDNFGEKDPTIKRTQFLLNQYELDSYPTNKNITYAVPGLIDITKALPQISLKQRILYSAGPPANLNFKNLRDVITDRERFNFSESLINFTQQLSVELDIKVHPAGWEASAELFYKLIENIPSHKKPNILLDGSIERILRNYQIVVIDIITTRVLSFCLYHNLEIVLYVPRDYRLNYETFQDLEKRAHIVRDESELHNILKAYSDGSLQNKSCIEFNIKYFGKLSHLESLQEAYKTLVS